MRFIGVDLASQPAGTSLCVLDWTDRARVVELVRPADDTVIIERADDAAGVGIDAPFGWPSPFVEVLTRHRRGEASTIAAHARRDLRLRTTDQWVRGHGATRDPLSVSTDRIGIVALRAIGILEQLVGPGADRSGGAGVAETYPAGSLAVWGLPATGYKARPANRSPDRDTLDPATTRRAEIVAALAERLDLGPHAAAMTESDDDLDAVICAVVAGLAFAGATTAPPPQHAAIAAIEGWIHLPTGPLDQVTEISWP